MTMDFFCHCRGEIEEPCEDCVHYLASKSFGHCVNQWDCSHMHECNWEPKEET